MPGVHLIVTIPTIATITEKSVSDQMDASLLAIPTIATIFAIAIAGIGSSIPAIVTIVDDRNDHMDTDQGSQTIRTIVIFPKVHCSSGSFHADFDFTPKNNTLKVF